MKLFLALFILGLLGSGAFGFGSVLSAYQHTVKHNLIFLAGSTAGTFLGILLGGLVKR